MTLAMTLTVVTAGLASQTQGVGGTTCGLAAHLAHATHNVLTALTNVTGDLGSTLDGLTENSKDVRHF